VVRVRPLNERENKAGFNGKTKCIKTEPQLILLDRGMDTKKFTFDFVGDEQID
jgi:hypothetical protein